MNTAKRAISIVVVLLFLGSALTPFLATENPAAELRILEPTPVLAATDLVVTNETFNYVNPPTDYGFNDDDFIFFVRNHTHIVAQANVSLYNATDLTLYDSELTIGGDGSAVFYNVPQGTYIWNVTWSQDPSVHEDGMLVSDGPEVFTSYELGNLDWENNDDDFNATVTDIDGNPAEGLNFTVYSRDTNTTWDEVLVDGNGTATFMNITEGNYTYYVTVMQGSYTGTVVDQGDFVSDGTLKLVHQTIGPISGDPDYYDLEVFTYYETSLDPIAGAQVNVTYYNGTLIESQDTPSNGTAMFLDLPVDFINWTVRYAGLPIGLGNYSYNLTVVSADIRDPVLTSPGDQEFLFDTENITVTWQLYDEHPSGIEVFIDQVRNTTLAWTNSTFEYTFNVTGTAIGVYEIKLVASDQNGNIAEDIIELRIYEDVFPVIEGPDDIDFFYTETGHALRWNVTDDNLNKYNVSLDGELVYEGELDPEAPFVEIGLGILEIGVHVYTFMANDTSGNAAFDNVTVTVKTDNTAPVFSYVPSTVYYVRGASSVMRNWTAHDDFMLSYNITVDGFLVEESDWTSETIEFDFAGLSEGAHFVVLTVYDLGGNSARASVMVVVTPPTIITYGLFIAAVAGCALLIVFAVWYFRYR
ncbi:MAG: hypothetical protein JSW61_07975 [Candidatus Thorarchaeota archaeon]|nr:MAG: hypothetical protein JSW61_07975 [Candidatus Thorarchaeota archaeon]